MAGRSPAPLGIGLGVWLILGSIDEIVTRSWRAGGCLSAVLAPRRAGLPRSAWGTAIAHAGVGVTVHRHRRDGLGRRAHRRAEARRDGWRLGGLHGDAGRRRAAQRPDFRETVARLRSCSRRAARSARSSRASASSPRRTMPTTEAGLRDASASARSMPASARSSPTARRAAHLLEAAGAADLARRGGDGARRRPVAARPARPGRRPGARPRPPAAPAAGGVTCVARSPDAACCHAVLPPLAAGGSASRGPGARRAARRDAAPIRRWSSRARALSAELRCLVCQNQSIDDSDAPSGPRPAPARARAAQGRRQRQRHPRRSSSPATASSCCCGPPSTGTTRCCSGWRPSPCCWPAGRWSGRRRRASQRDGATPVSAADESGRGRGR